MSEQRSRAFVLRPGEGRDIDMGNFGMSLKATGEDTENAFSLLEAEEPPNFGPPMHIHHDAAEAFYVISGEYVIFIEEDEYVCAAGSFIYIAAGVPHGFRVGAGPIGHRPAPSEVASWQNSLMALSMLIDQAELNDHGVILEYQLGNTSRRLDAMLTGHSPTSAENAVVVELKQWSNGTIGPSKADNCVELHVGNQVRRELHPSVQVGGYQEWLLDNHEVFYETNSVALAALDYLHNMQPEPDGELWLRRQVDARRPDWRTPRDVASPNREEC